MGFILMGRVVQSRRYHGTTRMILLLLAMRADDETGECWPRIATIAHEANISERAVQKAVRQLVTDGAVNREARYSKTGGNISNIWRLCAVNFDGVITPRIPESSPGGGEPVFTGGVNQCSPQGEPVFTPQGEPVFTPKKTSIENHVENNVKNTLLREAPAPAVVAPQPAQGRTPDGGAVAQESKSEKQKQKAEREQSRAAIWRALADAGLPEPHSRREISGQNAAIYSLMAAGATPGQIAPAVAAFHALWPKAVCTVNALDKHWSLLQEGPKNETQRQLENAARGAEERRLRERADQDRRAAELASDEVQRILNEILDPTG